jgi:hypothetical protein
MTPPARSGAALGINGRPVDITPEQAHSFAGVIYAGLKILPRARSGGGFLAPFSGTSFPLPGGISRAGALRKTTLCIKEAIRAK